MNDTAPAIIDGPFFDELEIGQRFDGAPSIALTDGLAAAHHAIVGGRLRLPFDPELSNEVTGDGILASPAFAWDIAIGQSTLVTRNAIANLFYHGLMFRRLPMIGDTLTTATTIAGLRPASPKPGRPPRGLVTMHIVTRDQKQRAVLDFHRCALLPARREPESEPRGKVDLPTWEPTQTDLAAPIAGWALDTFHTACPGPHFEDLTEGAAYRVAGGDVVTSAPELARLTMNLATIHHDAGAGESQRLVYGGHTIGLAAAQITRALPAAVTVLGWHGCNHTGPVHEGDTLHSLITIERLASLQSGGLAHLRVDVRATAPSGEVSDVLVWRPIVLFA